LAIVRKRDILLVSGCDVVTISSSTSKQPHSLWGVFHFAPRSITNLVKGFMLLTSVTNPQAAIMVWTRRPLGTASTQLLDANVRDIGSDFLCAVT
jgi:hypothetical protein